MKLRSGQILYGITITALFAFIIGMAYYTWTLGSDEDDYKIVCIGGHEYYRANFAYKMSVAIRLTDDGKPITCIYHGLNE